MPALLFQAITIASDIFVFLFVIYFFVEFRTKEKEIKIREKKIDTDYHQVVDTALSRERKILDDATQEAEQIISSTKYVSEHSKSLIDQTLQTLAEDIQKHVATSGQEFNSSYQASLKQVSDQSLNEFKTVLSGMEQELQNNIKRFNEVLLPNLEKEIAEYKKARLDQAEQEVVQIVQKVSQEVFNKSLPLSDHQNLVIESFEKAKREGIF